jgi:AraC family transcriptional regulator, regulatory protein of adaptative response / methylated-DNA-[protein]-cysteine methyltransferase
LAESQIEPLSRKTQLIDLKASNGVRDQDIPGMGMVESHESPDMNKRMPKPQPIESDPRWTQILTRDPKADGKFWYSVSTTGVYCRPSCHSRAANPKNVAIHDSLRAAKAAGMRACKRCNPDALSIAAVNATIIAKTCRLIEQSETPLSLARLAATAGLSPSHFHRQFKAATGLTPQAYAAAIRTGRIRTALPAATSITETIFEAGFNSSGRFYEKSTATLGMTPSRYRSGGAGEKIRFAVGLSSLGSILVACSDKGVAFIALGDDPAALVKNLQTRFPKAQLIGGDQNFESLIARIVGFVETPVIGLDLPLDIRGTAFQQRVWQALQQIPLGETKSYTEIAQKIGAPKAIRAVAGACAANNLALAIPCHRVIRTDGAISGYAWGVERKRKLLDREQQSRDP